MIAADSAIFDTVERMFIGLQLDGDFLSSDLNNGWSFEIFRPSGKVASSKLWFIMAVIGAESLTETFFKS